MFVEQLIEKLKTFANGKNYLICQVVGKETGAWNMSFDLAKVPGNNDMVALTASNPALRHLPMDDALFELNPARIRTNSDKSGQSGIMNFGGKTMYKFCLSQKQVDGLKKLADDGNELIRGVLAQIPLMQNPPVTMAASEDWDDAFAKTQEIGV